MNDGRAHGALGEGALRRLEFELEAERVKRRRSTGQVACRLLRKPAAGEQAPIGCLGRVIAAGDACAAANLLGQSANGMQEIDVVASEIVYAFKRSQRWRFRALVADQTPNDGPILLLDDAAIVLAIRTVIAVCPLGGTGTLRHWSRTSPGAYPGK